MPRRQNSIDLSVSASTDGFTIGGGATERNLTIKSGDITIEGGTGNVFDLPNTSDTLVGETAEQTLTNKIITGSFTGSGRIESASYAVTASYVSGALAGTVESASYAVTSSFANRVFASNVVGTVTSASYALTSSFASRVYGSNVVGTVTSASAALTSSFANRAKSVWEPVTSASFAQNALTANNATSATSASHATSMVGTGSFYTDSPLFVSTAPIVSLGGSPVPQRCVLFPTGARFFLANSLYSGSIQIVLPLDSQTQFSMMTMEIDGYQYDNSAGFKIIASGYWYSSEHRWVNHGAIVLGNDVDFETVKFATIDSGTVDARGVILIGDNQTQWHYTNVIVSKVLVGAGRENNLQTGWSGSLVFDTSSYTDILTINKNNFYPSSSYALTANSASYLLGKVDASNIVSSSIGGPLIVPTAGDRGWITANATDNFSFNSALMPHYGIKWSDDPAAASSAAWISGNGGIRFFTVGASRWLISQSGHFVPESNDTLDIGSPNSVVRNIYTDALWPRYHYAQWLQVSRSNDVYNSLTNQTFLIEALEKSILTNQFWFENPIAIEYYSASAWHPDPASGSAAYYNLTLGRNAGTAMSLPISSSGWEKWRITMLAPSYRYLDYLYLYTSTNGHGIKLAVEKSVSTSSVDWVAHFTTSIWSAWPAHQFIPHTSFGIHPSSTNVNQSKYVRMVFEPSYSGVYPSNDIDIYHFNWYGSYPGNQQNQLWSWNRDKGVSFTSITASAGISGLINSASFAQNALTASYAVGSVGGNGTPNYIPKWNGASTLTNSIISEIGGAIYVPGHISSSNTVYADESVTVRNPNNKEASVSLNWVNDDPRIRVGGTGAGSSGVFRIQGGDDANRFSVDVNGNGYFAGLITGSNILSKGYISAKTYVSASFMEIRDFDGASYIDLRSYTESAIFRAFASSSRAAGNQWYDETSATLRWAVYKDSDHESGANSGSNYSIYRYADNGSYLGRPVRIHRVSGDIDLESKLRWGGGPYIASSADVGAASDVAARLHVSGTTVGSYFVGPKFAGFASSSVGNGVQSFPQIGGFLAPPYGNTAATSPFFYAWEGNQLQMAHNQPGVQIAYVSGSGSGNFSNVFDTLGDNWVELYGLNSGGDVIVEISGLNLILGSANTQGFAFIEMHGGQTDFKMEVGIDTNAYEEVLNAAVLVTSNPAVKQFTTANGGAITKVRLTFTNIQNPAYVRRLGIIPKNRQDIHNWLNTAGGSMFGDVNFYTGSAIIHNVDSTSGVLKLVSNGGPFYNIFSDSANLYFRRMDSSPGVFMWRGLNNYTQMILSTAGLSWGDSLTFIPSSSLVARLDQDNNFGANDITASAFKGDGSQLTGISAGGISWSTITGGTTASVDNGYFTNSASQLSVYLPTTATVGQTVRIAGIGSGGWRLRCNASQTIYFGNDTSTTGAAGYLQSSHQRDAVEVVCVTTNTAWQVISSVGAIDVV